MRHHACFQLCGCILPSPVGVPCVMLAPMRWLCLQVKGYDTLHGELVAMGVHKTQHVLLLQLSKEQELLYKGYLEVHCVLGLL